MNDVESTTNTSIWKVLVVIFAVLTPRFILALINIEIVEPDIVVYQGVAQAFLNGESLLSLSRNVYPPLSVFFEVVPQLITNATGLHYSLAIKLFIFAGDIAMTLLILKQTQSLGWALFYALNPLTISTAAGHTQLDVLTMLPVVIGIIMLKKERYLGAGLISGFGVALKFYPVFFIGAVALYMIIDQEERADMWHTVAYGGGAIAVWLAFTIPMALLDGWGHLWRPISFAGGSLIGDLGGLQLLGSLGLPIRGMGNGQLPGLLGELISRGKVALGMKLVFGVTSLIIFLRYRIEDYAELLLVFIVAFYALSGGVSPNWLLWVLPFIALCGRKKTGLWYTLVASIVLICFVMAIYPEWYVPGYPKKVAIWVSLWRITNGFFVLFSIGWLVSIILRFEKEDRLRAEPFQFVRKLLTSDYAT